MFALLTRLWNDETGSIVATEYLMLGTIVGVGSATGLVAVRDSINDEYQEFGNSVREVRQAYSVPVKKAGKPQAGGASAGGAVAVDAAAPPAGQVVTFSTP